MFVFLFKAVGYSARRDSHQYQHNTTAPGTETHSTTLAPHYISVTLIRALPCINKQTKSEEEEEEEEEKAEGESCI